MPTKTKPTQTEMIEILATKVMNWVKPEGCGNWYENTGRKGSRQFAEDGDWNPFADLNAVHDLEERLTEEQWGLYLCLFEDEPDPLGGNWLKSLRHATADICAEAICRVVAPEVF